MMFSGNALFKGTLMHRRYLPVRHALSYQVADVLLDVDSLSGLNSTSRLIGYNRRRLFSINDRNHGARDETPIAVHVRGLMSGLQLDEPISRIFMLCYPAVLGKVFNPLTVYFGLADDGRWLAVVYEVRNTFGECHSYVLPVVEGASHRAEKCFYVSPFNNVEGEYRFRVDAQDKHLRLNIALLERGAMKLAARFEGDQQPLTDMALMRGFLRLFLQPVKVVVAIHWEAIKLYLKGLRPTPRPTQQRTSVSTSPIPRPSINTGI